MLGADRAAAARGAPSTCSGSARSTTCSAGIALGLDVFDCAVPTRLARHGIALAPSPETRFRLDLRKGRWAGDRDPLVEGCPCPACTRHTRDYVTTSRAPRN